MQGETDVSSTTHTKGAKPKRKWGKLLLGLVILILLAAVGVLGWQLKVYIDKDAKNTADKKSLQGQVDNLTKQLSDTRKLVETSTATTATACSTQVQITTTVKNNISAAVSSHNYAALQSYMASQVTVVYAASEKGGSEGSAAAVTDMNYLNNATGTWDFNVAPATIVRYQAGDYAQYFQGVIYVGQSTDKFVVAFGFDMCGKINRIFITPSSDLL